MCLRGGEGWRSSPRPVWVRRQGCPSLGPDGVWTGRGWDWEPEQQKRGRKVGFVQLQDERPPVAKKQWSSQAGPAASSEVPPREGQVETSAGRC